MADRRHELLRPEDATSWQEFQERWAIERARYRGARRSWKDVARIALSVIPGLAAIVFWIAVGLADTTARWVLLVLALLCTGLFVWDIAGVVRKRWRRSRRYRQLGRLRDEWQKRVEHGEIPQSTPGGAKVWRDELGAEARSQ